MTKDDLHILLLASVYSHIDDEGYIVLRDVYGNFIRIPVARDTDGKYEVQTCT
jgi:hypothetical protein